MSIVRVFNESKQVLLGDRVTLADTSETRRNGLLKHESLPKGEGLWIIPCEAVHAFRMKFAIDVVFIDKHKRVTKIVPAMKKSRTGDELARAQRSGADGGVSGGDGDGSGGSVGDYARGGAGMSCEAQGGAACDKSQTQIQSPERKRRAGL